MGQPRADLKYEPICALGSGAFGSVVQCRRLGGEGGPDIVAVKATRKEDGAWGLKLGLHEAKMLKACDHPTVVKLLDAFQSRSGRAYLVMEYVEFCASSLLNTFPYGLPVAQLKLTAWQLCVALRYVHSRGILHRDVKPANILIARDGSTKLCDFGMARQLGSRGFNTNSDSLLTNYVITRWYRPPEVLLGTSYGPSADVFSLGCTIAELATGATLFPGTSSLDQLDRLASCLGPLPANLSAASGRTAAASAAAATAGATATASAIATPVSPPVSALSPLPRERGLRQRLAAMGGMVPEPQLLQFIEACLELDPAKRLTPHELLQLPYFDDVGLLVSGSPLEGLYVRECQVGEAPLGATGAEGVIGAGDGAPGPAPAVAPDTAVMKGCLLSVAEMLRPDQGAALHGAGAGPGSPRAATVPAVIVPLRLVGSGSAAQRVLCSAATGHVAQPSAAAGAVAGVSDPAEEPAAAAMAVATVAPAEDLDALVQKHLHGTEVGAPSDALWAAVGPTAPAACDTDSPHGVVVAASGPHSEPTDGQGQGHGQPCVVLDVNRLFKMTTAELAGHATNVSRLCASVEAAASAAPGLSAAARPTVAVAQNPPGVVECHSATMAGQCVGAGSEHPRRRVASDIVCHGLTADERLQSEEACSCGACAIGSCTTARGSGRDIQPSFEGDLPQGGPGEMALPSGSALNLVCRRTGRVCQGEDAEGTSKAATTAAAAVTISAVAAACAVVAPLAPAQDPELERGSGAGGAAVTAASPAAEAAEAASSVMPSATDNTAGRKGCSTGTTRKAADAEGATAAGGAADEGECWHVHNERFKQAHVDNERRLLASMRAAESGTGAPPRPAGGHLAQAGEAGPTQVGANTASGAAATAAAATIAAPVPAQAAEEGIEGTSPGLPSLSFSAQANGRLLLTAAVAAAVGSGASGVSGGRYFAGGTQSNMDTLRRSSTLESSLLRTVASTGCGAGAGASRFAKMSSVSGLGLTGTKVVDLVGTPEWAGVGEMPSGSVCCVPDQEATGPKGRSGCKGKGGGFAAAARALFVCLRPPSA